MGLSMDSNNNVEIIAIIGTVIVALISIIAPIIQRKTDEQNMLIRSVTANRMDWIASVRELMTQFCEAFISNPNGFNDLCHLRTKLFLYMRHDREAYDAFIKSADACCEINIPPTHHTLMYNRLILTSQYVLATVWIRVKEEGTHGKTKDERINKTVADRTLNLRKLIDNNLNGFKDCPDVYDYLSPKSIE